MVVLGMLQEEKRRRRIDYGANPTDPTVTRAERRRGYVRCPRGGARSLLF